MRTCSSHIWEHLYAQNPTLWHFVSIADLKSGNHLTRKSHDPDEQHRRKVVLVDNNWKEAYKQASIQSFLLEQFEAERRRNRSVRGATGVYRRKRSATGVYGSIGI